MQLFGYDKDEVLGQYASIRMFEQIIHSKWNDCIPSAKTINNPLDLFTFWGCYMGGSFLWWGWRPGRDFFGIRFDIWIYNPLLLFLGGNQGWWKTSELIKSWPTFMEARKGLDVSRGCFLKLCTSLGLLLKTIQNLIIVWAVFPAICTDTFGTWICKPFKRVQWGMETTRNMQWQSSLRRMKFLCFTDALL